MTVNKHSLARLPVSLFLLPSSGAPARFLDTEALGCIGMPAVAASEGPKLDRLSCHRCRCGVLVLARVIAGVTCMPALGFGARCQVEVGAEVAGPRI